MGVLSFGDEIGGIKEGKLPGGGIRLLRKGERFLTGDLLDVVKLDPAGGIVGKLEGTVPGGIWILTGGMLLRLVDTVSKFLDGSGKGCSPFPRLLGKTGILGLDERFFICKFCFKHLWSGC